MMSNHWIPLGKDDVSEYYAFGWDYLGPFLYGFTRWLINGIEKRQYDKVFFFSRDGYMMHNSFQILSDLEIDSEYVYFSRKSIRQAMLWKSDNFHDSLQFLTWERFYSLGKILEYYGFDEAERFAISKIKNWDLEKDIAYGELESSPLISTFYNEYRHIIEEKSKEQCAFLERYLRQIGMSGRCAIVDIGWHGSMQYYLERFIDELGLDIQIEGYYVGILPNVPLDNPCYGYVYNKDNPEKRKNMLCFFGGYEKLFQGFDGSTYGYQEDDQAIVPVFNRYEYDDEEGRRVVKVIEEWQKGALDFVRQGKRIGLNPSDDELTAPLIHVGMAPRLKQVKLFSFFYNNDGTKAYFIPQKRLLQYRAREFMHSLSNSPWKTGFLKAAFKIPFPYYLVYRVIRK